MKNRIALTGGAGFIGSHICVELQNEGYSILVIDDFRNSRPEVLDRIRKISGKRVEFLNLDICQTNQLEIALLEQKIEAVIHLAGLKSVGESSSQPLHYYDNNIGGTISLLKAMEKGKIKNLVFSSSATVYGIPEKLPINEESRLSACNPYARTKLFIEELLRDLHRSNSAWNVAILRYFNPVGAHPSGLIGEEPTGIPNNLFPFLAQVAIGERPFLTVFGNDYPTPDGTGIRDYIHVVDLAKGHIRAMEKLRKNPGLVTYNLGTGKGYSVLEIIAAYEKSCGKKIPFQFGPRRRGDVAICYADTKLAWEELGWTVEKSLKDMCNDSWRWQNSLKPRGS